MKEDEGARYFGPFAHAGALRQTLAFMRKKIRRADLRPRQSDRARAEILDLSGADETRRHDRGAIPRACRARVRISRRPLEGTARRTRTARCTPQPRSSISSAPPSCATCSTTCARRPSRWPATRATSATASASPAASIREADLAALADALGLGAPPRRMECFDISNISTTHIVASMVCFLDGRPANHHYRRFRIKTVEGQDDFASMARGGAPPVCARAARKCRVPNVECRGATRCARRHRQICRIQ